MRDDRFKSLLGSLSRLSQEQLAELLSKVQGLQHGNHGIEALETGRGAFGCPHCAATNTVKNGHSHGLPGSRSRRSVA